jgi:hypothetical protein
LSEANSAKSFEFGLIMLGAVSAPLVAAICLYCLLAYLRCLPASILPACISPFICRRRGEEKKEQVGRPCLVSMLPQPEPEEIVSGTCPKDFNLLLDTPPLSPFLKADPRHAAMRWLNEAESPAEDEPEDEPALFDVVPESSSFEFKSLLLEPIEPINDLNLADEVYIQIGNLFSAINLRTTKLKESLAAKIEVQPKFEPIKVELQSVGCLVN